VKAVKKIEIIGAKQGRWYFDLIGCTFNVTKEAKEAYYVTVGNISDKYLVEKCHAKVIEWVEISYADSQAKWVRENEIKIGSKVRVKDKYNPFDEIFIIEKINKDYIMIEGCLAAVSYVALEPVK